MTLAAGRSLILKDAFTAHHTSIFQGCLQELPIRGRFHSRHKNGNEKEYRCMEKPAPMGHSFYFSLTYRAANR